MRICSPSVPRLKHEWNHTVGWLINLRCGTAVFTLFTYSPAPAGGLRGHCIESFLGCFFHMLTSSSHFFAILGRGSFRTIDPVTTPRRNWVQDGSLLLFSRASRGGAISRRRYPSARFGHFRRRFWPFHLPRTELRAARTAQALPLGNPLTVSSAHRRKTRLRRFRKRRRRYRRSQICRRSSSCVQVWRQASQRYRFCRRRLRHPPPPPPPQDRLTNAVEPLSNLSLPILYAARFPGVISINARAVSCSRARLHH